MVLFKKKLDRLSQGETVMDPEFKGNEAATEDAGDDGAIQAQRKEPQATEDYSQVLKPNESRPVRFQTCLVPVTPSFLLTSPFYNVDAYATPVPLLYFGCK